MKKAFLLLLIFLSLVFSTQANDWYVATTGSSLGEGSLANPWDLDTALGGSQAPPPQIRPGDHIWLLAGVYHSRRAGGFKSSLEGTATAPIIVRNYRRGSVIIDGTGGMFAMYVARGYVWFWGLEFADLNAPRLSSTAGSNNGPSALAYGPWVGGQRDYAPGVKFINCYLHDTAQGFSGYNNAPDMEVYGSISVYNGYIGPDRPHGHGIYVQNSAGSKLIQDDFVGDNADEGIQAYGSPSSQQINTTIDHSTMWNTGSWGGGFQENMLLTGGAAHDNALTGSWTFFTLGKAQGSVHIGQYFRTSAIKANDNVFVGGNITALVEGVDSPVEFQRNRIVNLPSGTQYMMAVGQFAGQSLTGYTWNHNDYYGGPDTFYKGLYDGNNLTGGAGYAFATWKSQTGFDANSTFHSGLPTGKWIFVRPNKYETKRANVTVYNWDAYGPAGNVVLGRSPSVSVDLSSVLSVGDDFQIVDVQNFNGPPVASGTYRGGSVAIPMEGLAKAPLVNAPEGHPTPAHTAPAFGTFIVLSSRSIDIPQPASSPHP